MTKPPSTTIYHFQGEEKKKKNGGRRGRLIRLGTAPCKSNMEREIMDRRQTKHRECLGRRGHSRVTTATATYVVLELNAYLIYPCTPGHLFLVSGIARGLTASGVPLPTYKT